LYSIGLFNLRKSDNFISTYTSSTFLTFSLNQQFSVLHMMLAVHANLQYPNLFLRFFSSLQQW
jgi:hypothetical protein